MSSIFSAHQKLREFLNNGNNVRNTIIVYVVLMLYGLIDSGLIFEIPLESMVSLAIISGLLATGLNCIRKEGGEIVGYGGIRVPLTRTGALLQGYVFVLLATIPFLGLLIIVVIHLLR